MLTYDHNDNSSLFRGAGDFHGPAKILLQRDKDLYVVATVISRVVSGDSDARGVSPGVELALVVADTAKGAACCDVETTADLPLAIVVMGVVCGGGVVA